MYYKTYDACGIASIIKPLTPDLCGITIFLVFVAWDMEYSVVEWARRKLLSEHFQIIKIDCLGSHKLFISIVCNERRIRLFPCTTYIHKRTTTNVSVFNRSTVSCKIDRHNGSFNQKQPMDTDISSIQKKFIRRKKYRNYSTKVNYRVRIIMQELKSDQFWSLHSNLFVHSEKSSARPMLFDSTHYWHQFWVLFVV